MASAMARLCARLMSAARSAESWSNGMIWVLMICAYASNATSSPFSFLSFLYTSYRIMLGVTVFFSFAFNTYGAYFSANGPSVKYSIQPYESISFKLGQSLHEWSQPSHP